MLWVVSSLFSTLIIFAQSVTSGRADSLQVLFVKQCHLGGPKRWVFSVAALALWSNPKGPNPAGAFTNFLLP